MDKLGVWKGCRKKRRHVYGNFVWLKDVGTLSRHQSTSMSRMTKGLRLQSTRTIGFKKRSNSSAAKYWLIHKNELCCVATFYMPLSEANHCLSKIPRPGPKNVSIDTLKLKSQNLSTTQWSIPLISVIFKGCAMVQWGFLRCAARFSKTKSFEKLHYKIKIFQYF